MAKGNIIILNRNYQERDFITKFCQEIGSVFSASSVEEAISLLESNNCNLAVVDSDLAKYTSLKGLFKNTTSIIITGTDENNIKAIVKEWPLERYLDFQIISPQAQSNSSLLRPLKRAMEHSLLKSEVENLKKSIELLQIELKETHFEIRDMMNFIQESIVKELEKRIMIEAKYLVSQKEKRKIEKILRRLYNANDVTNLLDVVYDIKEIIQAGGITIYIMDENEKLGKYLKPLVWNDVFIIHRDFSRYIALIDDQDFAAISARSSREINSAYLSFDQRLSKRYTEMLNPPLKNILCVPITHDKEVTGVLEVYNKTIKGKIRKEGFTKEDHEILRRLSEHMSIAMTKLNLIQYDALTGLLRPESFFEKVIQKIHSSSKRRREEGSYAMVMGDVDWFKNYNDRNGHEAGNKLLRELAKVLKSSVREEDLLCRYGGEEFLIFLTGINDMKEACCLTDRIRKNVEEHYFEYQEFQPKNNLTISFGLTLFPKEKIQSPTPLTKDELKKIINEADIALSEAKGRRPSSLGPPEEQEKDLVKNKVCAFYGGQTEEKREADFLETYIETFPEEKRKYKRYYTSTFIIYSENSSHKVTRTINLSLGGAKIISESKLPVAQTINLFLILGKKATQFESEVVYSSSTPDNSSRFCSGLKFKDLSLNDKKILDDHFHSLSK